MCVEELFLVLLACNHDIVKTYYVSRGTESKSEANIRRDGAILFSHGYALFHFENLLNGLRVPLGTAISTLVSHVFQSGSYGPV